MPPTTRWGWRPAPAVIGYLYEGLPHCAHCANQRFGFPEEPRGFGPNFPRRDGTIVYPITTDHRRGERCARCGNPIA